MSYEKEKEKLFDWHLDEWEKPLKEGLPEGETSAIHRELNKLFHEKGIALKEKYGK